MDEAVKLQNDIEPVFEIYCSRCKINYCTGGETLYEAAQIMVDVGWRKIGKRAMCPDCAKSNVTGEPRRL